ncbi:unnamed protein product [Echinostoma caproni]|uniref:Uncharacterized protein n=1 Tax=Echinostoma caproni TaxID=27848 RepID=A0A183B0Q1_9TREM|nr:unnamed protein product [Echinostoma caproni]
MRLRPAKETPYVAGRRNSVKDLSVLIRAEGRRLNEMHVETVLGNTNFREMWTSLRKLCGSCTSSCPNVEVLNRQFASVPASSSLTPPFPTHDAINPVSPDEVRQVLRRLKANKAHGSDELAPHLLKACANQLATPIAELISTCLSSGTTPLLTLFILLLPSWTMALVPLA